LGRKTAQGRVVKGDGLEAPNLDAALAHLRDQRIRPIPNRVREKGKGLDREFSIPGFGESVKTKDVSLMTRQLATMIDAGLPIVQCLDILCEQSENKLLRNTVAAVKKDVEGGSNLADALRKHPKIFDDLYVNMVEAGEAGGILNTILNRIALFIEKAARLRKKVKGAMIYPCAIVGCRGHRGRRLDDLRDSRVCGFVRRHGAGAADADADLHRYQQLVRCLLVCT
jgi:type IV pilus assembly protein PilC